MNSPVYPVDTLISTLEGIKTTGSPTDQRPSEVVHSSDSDWLRTLDSVRSATEMSEQ